MEKMMANPFRARQKPLWRNISFTLMWSSTAASGFGDRMIMLAAAALLGIHLGETDASSINAGINLWFFLPYFFLGLVGGWIADTLPRKWVLFSCDEIRGLLLILAVFMVPTASDAAIDSDYYWRVYGMLFLVGFLASVFTPTRNATVPQIVPMMQLQSANAIIMCIAVVFSLLGMGIGGWLIKGDDSDTVRIGLLIGAMLYLFSGWFFAFLRPKVHEGEAIEGKKSEVRRLVEAVRYVWDHKRILRLVFLSMMFWGAAYIMINATAAFAKERWYTPGDDNLIFMISILSLFIGLGMLFGAIFMSAIATRRESYWLGLLGILASSLCMVLLAFCPSFVLAMVLCFFAGFTGNMALVVINTLTQSLSADYIRGRVFGIRDVTDNASNITVNLIIWQLPHADAWMTPTLIGTAAVLAVVSIYGLLREMPRGTMPCGVTNIILRVVRLYVMVWHRVLWVQKHNIPKEGPVLLTANHTTGLDPFVLQPAIPRLVRWVMLTSYRYRALNPLWRRIDPICLELETSDMNKLRQIISKLKEGEMVGFFPEGQLQREKRELQPFMPGIGMIARRSGASILPAWIDGTPCTKSMLWHFLRPSRTTVVFGEPWKPEKGMSDEQIIEELRFRMLKLKAMLETGNAA